MSEIFRFFFSELFGRDAPARPFLKEKIKNFKEDIFELKNIAGKNAQLVAQLKLLFGVGSSRENVWVVTPPEIKPPAYCRHGICGDFNGLDQDFGFKAEDVGDLVRVEFTAS